MDSQTHNPVDRLAKVMLPLTDNDYGAHNERTGSRGLLEEFAFARPNSA